MKTKILMLIVFLLAISTTDAQIMFQRHYGGTLDDGGSSVLQTDDGGYIVAGRTMSYGNGSNDIYVLKTDANGNELWSKIYGGYGWDAPFEIKKTLDNCYVIAGETSSFGAGASDAFLMKIDSTGDSLWFKTYGGMQDDGASGVNVCNDNGFIVTGVTMSFGDGQCQIYLIKTDENGDTLWTKKYGPSYANCFGNSVIQTINDGYIISGSFNYGNPKLYIIKTNSLGDTLWTKKFEYDGMYSGSTIRETNDGHYVVLGTVVNMANVSDIRLMGIDQIGDSIFTKDYGGINNEVDGEVQLANDNGFIITGLTQSYGAGGKDVYLIKTDENGGIQWSKTFGGEGDDWGGSVQQTSDNGYIISGCTKSIGNNYDIYLIKTNANGESTGVNEITDSNGLQIFPNPNKGTFEINLQNVISEDLFIEIVNANGQLVYENQLSKATLTSLKVDLSKCSKGMYFVKVQNANNLLAKKIVIF